MDMSLDELVDVGDIPGYSGIRPLGRGGMGVVYLARQDSLNRMVAIKLLAPIPRADPAMMAARFRREAELMARVSHPNIVAIHDFGVVDGRPYLVMEYVEGGDLGAWIEPDRPLSTARVRPLALPIAGALGCLHRSRILHRDLKPTNILMFNESTPMVSDFGIAVLDATAGDLTQTGHALGTPGYVAPEQQYKLKVDERTDQYSMAAVFYELLTGRKPLGAFHPPSKYNPEVGPEADAVLLRGLHEEREGRYPTIEEFGTALDAALGAGPVARPTLTRRRALGAVGLVAVVVAGLGVATWARRDVPGNPPLPKVEGIATAPDRDQVKNSLGMTLVLIRPGTFVMGAPASEPDSQPDERPQHTVRIATPFYLQTCEVTVGQFRRFVEATRYVTDAERRGGGYYYDMKVEKVVQVPWASWKRPGGSSRVQADDEPVVQVSYNDALAFCDWLARKEGWAYRLPTEAEWEFACRAGTSTRWSSGEDLEALDASAWTSRNASARTHPVGQRKPNPLGLHDMHGNVWEWCSDWYGPYSDRPAEDPTGPTQGRRRVVRGGGWDWPMAAKARSASRLSYAPDQGFFTYGFRVARAAERPAPATTPTKASRP